MFKTLECEEGPEGQTYKIQFNSFNVSITEMDDRVLIDLETLKGKKITGTYAMFSEVLAGVPLHK
jgi:hypothetical protein